MGQGRDLRLGHPDGGDGDVRVGSVLWHGRRDRKLPKGFYSTLLYLLTPALSAFDMDGDRCVL